MANAKRYRISPRTLRRSARREIYETKYETINIPVEKWPSNSLNRAYHANVNHVESDSGATQMSKAVFDDMIVDIICRTCGGSQPKSIGWLRVHQKLVCDDCGSATVLKNELRLDFDQFAQTMLHLRRSSSNQGNFH